MSDKVMLGENITPDMLADFEVVKGHLVTYHSKEKMRAHRAKWLKKYGDNSIQSFSAITMCQMNEGLLSDKFLYDMVDRPKWNTSDWFATLHHLAKKERDDLQSAELGDLGGDTTAMESNDDGWDTDDELGLAASDIESVVGKKAASVTTSVAGTREPSPEREPSPSLSAPGAALSPQTPLLKTKEPSASITTLPPILNVNKDTLPALFQLVKEMGLQERIEALTEMKTNFMAAFSGWPANWEEIYRANPDSPLLLEDIVEGDPIESSDDEEEKVEKEPQQELPVTVKAAKTYPCGFCPFVANSTGALGGHRLGCKATKEAKKAGILHPPTKKNPEDVAKLNKLAEETEKKRLEQLKEQQLKKAARELAFKNMMLKKKEEDDARDLAAAQEKQRLIAEEMKGVTTPRANPVRYAIGTPDAAASAEKMPPPQGSHRRMKKRADDVEEAKKASIAAGATVDTGVAGMDTEGGSRKRNMADRSPQVSAPQKLLTPAAAVKVSDSPIALTSPERKRRVPATAMAEQVSKLPPFPDLSTFASAPAATTTEPAVEPTPREPNGVDNGMMMAAFEKMQNQTLNKLNSVVGDLEGHLRASADSLMSKVAEQMNSMYENKFAAAVSSKLSELSQSVEATKKVDKTVEGLTRALKGLQGSMENRLDGMQAEMVDMSTKQTKETAKIWTAINELQAQSKDTSGVQAKEALKGAKETLAKVQKEREALLVAQKNAPAAPENYAEEMKQLKSEMKLQQVIQENRAVSNKSVSWGWPAGMSHAQRVKHMVGHCGSLAEQDKSIDNWSPYNRHGTMSPIMLTTLRTVGGRKKHVLHVNSSSAPLKITYEGKQYTIRARPQYGATTDRCNKFLIGGAKTAEKLLCKKGADAATARMKVKLNFPEGTILVDGVKVAQRMGDDENITWMDKMYEEFAKNPSV